MLNSSPAPHQMQLTDAHEGTETWTCSTCGRTILIEWDPWRRVVTVEGDQNVAHAGSKGGLRMGNINIDTGGA